MNDKYTRRMLQRIRENAVLARASLEKRKRQRRTDIEVGCMLALTFITAPLYHNYPSLRNFYSLTQRDAKVAVVDNSAPSTADILKNIPSKGIERKIVLAEKNVEQKVVADKKAKENSKQKVVADKKFAKPVSSVAQPQLKPQAESIIQPNTQITPFSDNPLYKDYYKFYLNWREPVLYARDKFDIEPALMLGLLRQESGRDVKKARTIESHAGAYGPAQLMPKTAEELDIDRKNPVANVSGGAKHLSELLDRFDRKDLALAAYNAGASRVKKYDGIPPYKETQTYVKRVKHHQEMFRRVLPSRHGGYGYRR